MPVVTLADVSKRYGATDAVREVALDVAEGEVVALVGPNGSGKTTIVDVTMGFVRPTAGDVAVFGRDPWRESLAVRLRTGVVPEGYGVYGRRSARRHVAAAVEATGAADDPGDVLARVGLADEADRPAGAFSNGMKKRLVLALALVGSPDLLVLDEPFAGLDPPTVGAILNVLDRFRQAGGSVLFTTHAAETVPAVADRVGFVHDGKLDGLRAVASFRTGPSRTLRVPEADPSEVREAVAGLRGVQEVARGDGGVTEVACGPGAVPKALATLHGRGIPLRAEADGDVFDEALFRSALDGGWR